MKQITLFFSDPHFFLLFYVSANITILFLYKLLLNNHLIAVINGKDTFILEVYAYLLRV